MNNNRKEIDIKMIEKYLNNELTESEVEFIELKMASDPEFRKLANDIDILIKGVRKEGAKHSQDELIENLRFTISSEIKDEKETSVIPIVRYWKSFAVAATVILIAVSTMLIGPFGSKSNDQIFEAYFTPPENTYYNTLRGDDDIENVIMHDAFFAYTNENYDVAIKKFDELTPDSDYASFSIYHGISYLATGDTDRAVSVLSSIDKENGMYNRAQWYLALAYIKIGTPYEIEKAKSILNNLIASTTRYDKQALELIDELK